MLQEHVKTRKTDKTRFFFAKNRWIFYPTNICSLMSHFNKPNIERKNCVWTAKYKRLLELCIVQHVEMKNEFTFQLTKLPFSTTVNCAKPVPTCWIYLKRPKTDIYVVWWWWHTLLCKKTSRDFEKRNHLPFWWKSSAHHNQIKPTLSQKSQKTIHLWHNRVDSPLVDTVDQKFISILISCIFSLQ